MLKGLGAGLGALGDINQMMKQAQEMQQKIAEIHERLETIEVEGSAGAGMVSAVCTAKGALRKVTIDPSCFNGEDKQVLEDLVVAAVNDAQEKAKLRMEEEMKEVTAGLPLPPGMSSPF